jgi:acyl-CoA synthetase (AMP-forming)/AMP-acid ligase II
MLCSNQRMISQVWPFLAADPPVLLDWLPWSHTFGGNHNVNLVLANGGSLWIDDGRPAPGLLDRTLRNLREVRPTIQFNVPAGYAALVPALERDGELAERFFSRLRLVFFAAAALPQALWERIERLAERHGATVTMSTAWGASETRRPRPRHTSPLAAPTASACRCREWRSNWRRSATSWRSASKAPTSCPATTAAPIWTPPPSTTKASTAAGTPYG